MGIDAASVIRATLRDIPYELYWFDKTKGTGYSPIPSYSWRLDSKGKVIDNYVKIIKDSPIQFAYHVAEEYQKDNSFIADTEKIKTISKTVDYAASIVEEKKNETDYNKLLAYKDIICDLVTYNEEAGKAQENTYPYGNPWQLIYVFDKKPETNVVCEGYSKAFKYLCDISAFNNKQIDCSLMTGTMTGGTGAGRHMWNMVHTGNGNNYLVDVTNCDSGSIGYSNKLFMIYDKDNKYSNSDDRGCTGYNITIGTEAIIYQYDDETIIEFDANERSLATEQYVEAGGTDVEDEQEAIDRQEAAGVTDIIKKLPAKVYVILSDEAAITAARKAYDKLTTEQKGYVLSETYKILTDAESAIKTLKAKQEADKLAAEKVINLINSLPDVNSININDLDKYNNIFSNIVAAYNKLSDDQQKLVESSMKKFNSIQAAIEKVVKEHNNKQNQTGTPTPTVIVIGGDGEITVDGKPLTPTETTAENAVKTNSIKKIGASGISTVGNIKKKTMTLGWKKVENAINYCVAYRKAGAKNWTYAWTQGQTKYVIKKLKANQMFEFKVAAYGVENNKWVYGGWSNVSYRYMAATTVKLKAGKRSFKATIKRVKKSSGYDVIYALNKAQTKSKKVKALKGAGKIKFVAKKLKKGKRYYVKVRPYKKYNGIKYVGILSKAYKVKVK